jgi:hypothetical protein
MAGRLWAARGLFLRATMQSGRRKVMMARLPIASDSNDTSAQMLYATEAHLWYRSHVPWARSRAPRSQPAEPTAGSPSALGR